MIYRNGGVDNPEAFGQIACSVGRLPIRFTVGTGGTISYCLVRSILERTDTIAVVGQVAQFNLTTKTQSWRGRVRSVFERTNNFAECRLVVRLTKDRTLGTGFPHGTHRTMSTPSLRDAPSSKGDDEIGGWDY